MTPNEIKTFISNYTQEVWNQHNVKAMDTYYSTAYIHHDVSGPDVRTLEDYKNWATMLLTGLSDFKVEINDLIAEPGKAVKQWTATGIHNNSFAGIPPTGKKMKFSGVSIYRLEENRIVESWYVYDMLGLLTQLGAMPTAVAA